MTSIASTLWPKPWILKLYAQAISEGCIRARPIGGEENFKSLAAAFYRARRKTDSSHDLFIEPSYHHCSITWDPANDAAIVTYDRLPDGMELPNIESVESSEFASSLALRRTPQLEPPTIEGEFEETEAKPDFNSADFVRSLMDKVGEKIESGTATSDDIGDA